MLPVSIECTKEGVKFSCQGDIGSGSVQLRQHSNVEKPSEAVEIDLTEPVSLTFSLKYLTNFCKASGLSDTVKLCLSSEVPLLVEYGLSNNSYLRFYLAPKVRSIKLLVQLAKANLDRLAMRSEQAHEVIQNQQCVSRLNVGDMRRNVFDLHKERLLGSWFRRVRLASSANPLVFRALVAKGRLLPHPSFHVIERGISDKEINTVPYSSDCPARKASSLSPCFKLTYTSFVAHMASDNLIPETRVLAIASHVRLICAQLQQGLQLMRYR